MARLMTRALACLQQSSLGSPSPSMRSVASERSPVRPLSSASEQNFAWDTTSHYVAPSAAGAQDLPSSPPRGAVYQSQLQHQRPDLAPYHSQVLQYQQSPQPLPALAAGEQHQRPRVPSVTDEPGAAHHTPRSAILQSPVVRVPLPVLYWPEPEHRGRCARRSSG